VDAPPPPPTSSPPDESKSHLTNIDGDIIDLTSDVDETEEVEVKQELRGDEASTSTGSFPNQKLEAHLRLAQSKIEKQENEIKGLKRNQADLLRQVTYLAESVHLLGVWTYHPLWLNVGNGIN